MALLAGPSGAGKSSLLDALAGLRRSRGVVALDERVWQDAEGRTRVPTAARRIGYAFQDLALFPTLSARENAAWAAPGSRAEAMRAADVVLERLGLAPIAHLRPTRLSGGQARRIALARALVMRPDVLLLDEPLSGLDHDSRRRVITLLDDELRDRRRPTLIASHEVGGLESLIEHVFVLERGRIDQHGPLAEVRRAPGSAFARTL